MCESKSDEHHTLTNRNNCPKFTEMCINRSAPAHVGGLVQFVLKVYDKYNEIFGENSYETDINSFSESLEMYGRRVYNMEFLPDLSSPEKMSKLDKLYNN